MSVAGKKLNLFERRKTSLEQIIEYFNQGFLAVFPIDWNTKNGKKGIYQGHFVILSGIADENNLLLHDPDTGSYQKYSKSEVENAYHHPAITDDLFVAFGRK
jgi:hypothetical protein